MKICVSFFFAFISFFLPVSLNASPALPGIFGKDDRKIVESLEPPFNAVGRVNIAGFSRTSLCTGTLIAPDKVITAAHCVFDGRTKKQHPTNIVHFVAGLRRDDFLAHSKVRDIRLLPDLNFTGKADAAFLKTDVAILHLEEHIDIQPVPILTDRPDIQSPLAHVSYARDRPFLPVIDNTCVLQAIQGDFWLTDCDTNFGGSGGPVFVIRDGQYFIGAVMVAVAQNKFSIALPRAVWEELLGE